MSSGPAPAFLPADLDGFVAGLRELAQFLTDNPKIPAPYAPSLMVFARGESEPERRAAVVRAAELMGTEVIEKRDHFKTLRRFGPIAYQVWGSTDVGYAEYDARRSYDDSVRL
ncbi:hypothetical protein [Phaeacidiphilus oryzae]|uniref:hypothetical protein n=1 Tax=Phaeacidiphilus oryzae TaxID=348818 RepID=UPI00056CED00|nr:hypothetical protein [Phaeacidiphilus oryzae]